MKYVLFPVFGLAVLFLSVVAVSAQLIPGDQTDPTAGKATAVQRFAVPEEVQYPYLSTYYVQPMVSPTDEVKISVFVTDWNHSKVRFGDDSHRFEITLRLTSDMASFQTFSIHDAPSGDHTFSLGTLAEGRYFVGLSCMDEKGRPSHTVWHQFCVQTAHEPASRTLTLDDFAAYGIVPEATPRVSYVDVPVPHNKLPEDEDEEILKIVQAKAKTVQVPKDRYVVVRPMFEDKPGVQGWRRSVVLYGAAYDKEAVAAEAAANTKGLQTLVDAMAAEGVERLVLPKEVTIRVCEEGLSIPSHFTLDLNGSTLKLNGFAGEKCTIVQMIDAHDSHVVHGTIEGDYYEHDYAHSDKHSEWVNGLGMHGYCRDSSYENLTVKNITGYGGENGLYLKDTIFPGLFWLTKTFEPGAIDRATGEIVADAPFQFTTRFHDLSQLKQGWLSVSRYLGYQGLVGQSWYYTIAFYDANKQFLSAEVAFQYRILPIPQGAKFLRVTFVEESLEKANEMALAATYFKIPTNCAFKKVRFERCRAVGLAQAAMRNMLVEECEFIASGEELARCAYDAEDGWDMMQDVTLRRNRFFDSPLNELLTCAGHNFVMEENEGNIHTWGRTQNACIRNNRGRTGYFMCDNQLRTMHSRYENNTFTEKITFGKRNRGEDDWFIALSGTFAEGHPSVIELGETGILRDASLRDLTLISPRCDHVALTNCTIKAAYANASLTDCTLTDSKLENLLYRNTFTDCRFVRTSIRHVSDSDTAFVRCVFEQSPIQVGPWSKPSTLRFDQCSICTDADSFLHIPVYAIGEVRFHECTFTGLSPKSPIFINDLRKNQLDPQGELEAKTGKIFLEKCSVESSSIPLLAAPEHGEKPSQKSIEIISSEITGPTPDPIPILLPTQMLPSWTIQTKP